MTYEPGSADAAQPGAQYFFISHESELGSFCMRSPQHTRVTGTTSVRSPTPTSTTTPTAPPSSPRPHSMLSMLIDIHMLLAPFVLIPQDAHRYGR